MDLGSILLGLALLAVIAFIVARPLIEQAAPREQPADPAEELLANREQVLAQLRDLDFDAATGKLNPEDSAAQRARLVAEGVAILKELDALGAGSGENAAPEDDIEAAIAAVRARRAAAKPAGRRKAGAAIPASPVRRPAEPTPAAQATSAAQQATIACGNCGRLARVGDQFCAQCGQALPASAAAGETAQPRKKPG